MGIDKEKHSTAQQDPIISKILGDLYKTEAIIAKKVEKTGDGKFKVTFNFPPYERTIQALDHVSMSQMHEAILEGLYCAIGQSIKDGDIDAPIDFRGFMANRLNTIYFHENLGFRRMLEPNEDSELTFEITGVSEKKLRKVFHAVRVRISGFIRGEIECLLEKEA